MCTLVPPCGHLKEDTVAVSADSGFKLQDTVVSLASMTSLPLFFML